jgi:hypothetical protein
MPGYIVCSKKKTGPTQRKRKQSENLYHFYFNFCRSHFYYFGCSWLAPPLSVVLAKARAGMKDKGLGQHYRRLYYTILMSLTQSFLNITSYNIWYLWAAVLARLTHDFMPLSNVHSSTFLIPASYSTRLAICPSRMVSPLPAFILDPPLSKDFIILLSLEVWMMRFSVWKRAFQSYNQIFTSLVLPHLYV